MPAGRRGPEAARAFNPRSNKYAGGQQLACGSRRNIPVPVPGDGFSTLAAQHNLFHQEKGKGKTQFTGLRASSPAI